MLDHTLKIVITGGTGGIGFQTAKALARQGHRVLVTGRDRARGEAAVTTLRRDTGNPKIELALGDLMELDSLNALAQDILRQMPRIDVLINNAGHLAQELGHNSLGFERDFAVNVVAPYALTRALLPAMGGPTPSRVLNVTGGLPIGGLDVSDLQAEKGFVPLPSYSNTKRAMEAMSLHEAPGLAKQGVHLNVVYPGTAATEMTGAMTRDSLAWYMKPAWPLMRRVMTEDDGGKSAAKAARSSIWGATSPELDGVYGRYFDARSKVTSLAGSVRDPANQAAVMAEITAKLPAPEPSLNPA